MRAGVLKSQGRPLFGIGDPLLPAIKTIGMLLFARLLPFGILHAVSRAKQIDRMTDSARGTRL
jgi:hypothetical protein